MPPPEKAKPVREPSSLSAEMLRSPRELQISALSASNTVVKPHSVSHSLECLVRLLFGDPLGEQWIEADGSWASSGILPPAPSGCARYQTQSGSQEENARIFVIKYVFCFSDSWRVL